MRRFKIRRVWPFVGTEDSEKVTQMGIVAVLARDAAELLGVPPVWPQEVATVVYPLMPKLVLRASPAAVSPRIPVGERAAYRMISSSGGSPRGSQVNVEV